jgi:hypothetical protein
MDIEKSIQNKIEERKNNIMKGFVSSHPLQFAQQESSDDLEKARNTGETKVGKDGITRVWTQLPNGKFDWRRQSAKSTPKSSSDAQTQGSASTSSATPPASASTTTDKIDSSGKSVFSNYLKNVAKIEEEEKTLKKYSQGTTFNGIKKDASEKRLKVLYQKESDYLGKFTQADKDKYEEHYSIPFDEDGQVGQVDDYSDENKKTLKDLKLSGSRMNAEHGYTDKFEKTMTSDISNVLQEKFKDKKITDVSLKQYSSQGGAWGSYNQPNFTRLDFSVDGVEYRVEAKTGEKMSSGRRRDNKFSELEVIKYNDKGQGSNIANLDNSTGFNDTAEEDSKSITMQKDLISKHKLAKDGYYDSQWSKEKPELDFKQSLRAYEWLHAASLIAEGIGKIK